MLSIGAKINDLGWPWRAITLCFKIRASFGAHCTPRKFNEDRLYNEWQRCSPMTLDSDNIRFLRIFAVVPWKGGIIQQWDNQKLFFSGFRTLCIRHLRKWGQHYYIVLFSPLSLFHWPQNTWPWVTFNGLNGHFTLYFHYYELPLSNYLLLICCRVCLHMRSVRSRVMDSDPQNIGSPRKNCGSFVDTTLSELGILTLSDLEWPFFVKYCFEPVYLELSKLGYS